MNYDYGSARQLSSGALRALESYKISESKRNIYVNFILQIYNCVSLLHSDYYSCCLFDKENICNTFILKYNNSEGYPFPGDIISVTKINVSILSDGEHKLFICEETKLLEKNKKFLISPKKLKSISSKFKLENNLKTNSSRKKNIKEIKGKKQTKEKKQLKDKNPKEETDSNNIFYEDISNINYNNINNITNINNINIDKKNKEEININSKDNTLKINPQKKDDFSQQEKDMILDSLNLFLDDFQEGSNESNNSINSINSNKNQNQKEESKDYSLLAKQSIKFPNQIKSRTQINKIINIQFKYISEIKHILSRFQHISVNFKFKIKCRVHHFDLNKKIIYKGCSICKKQILNKDKKCCYDSREQIFYFFYVTMRDATGICDVYFHDKQGRKFMGLEPEKFKYLSEDETPIGKIIFSEYKSDFYNNEFMIALEFNEDIKSQSKKYEAIKVERINKKHRYEMVKELKNILI